MKKNQVIFVGLAFTLASAAVFANTFAATAYYVGHVSETGAHCRVVVSQVPPCSTGPQYSKIQTINEVTGRYYFSESIDGSACQVVPGHDE